jgi:hypothetical protein
VQVEGALLLLGGANCRLAAPLPLPLALALGLGLAVRPGKQRTIPNESANKTSLIKRGESDIFTWDGRLTCHMGRTTTLAVCDPTPRYC